VTRPGARKTSTDHTLASGSKRMMAITTLALGIALFGALFALVVGCEKL
jgi:hypothetical protein